MQTLVPERQRMEHQLGVSSRAAGRDGGRGATEAQALGQQWAQPQPDRHARTRRPPHRTPPAAVGTVTAAQRRREAPGPERGTSRPSAAPGPETRKPAKSRYASSERPRTDGPGPRSNRTADALSGERGARAQEPRVSAAASRRLRNSNAAFSTGKVAVVSPQQLLSQGRESLSAQATGFRKPGR